MIWFTGSNLIIDDCEDISLATDIYSLLELKNMVIVVLYSDSTDMDKVEMRNVFAYNRKGEQLWQIKPQETLSTSSYSYVAMAEDGSGRVKVGSFWGGGYYLNIADGTVTPDGGRPW